MDAVKDQWHGYQHEFWIIVPYQFGRRPRSSPARGSGTGAGREPVSALRVTIADARTFFGRGAASRAGRSSAVLAPALPRCTKIAGAPASRRARIFVYGHASSQDRAPVAVASRTPRQVYGRRARKPGRIPARAWFYSLWQRKGVMSVRAGKDGGRMTGHETGPAGSALFGWPCLLHRQHGYKPCRRCIPVTRPCKRAQGRPSLPVRVRP